MTSDNHGRVLRRAPREEPAPVTDSDIRDQFLDVPTIDGTKTVMVGDRMFHIPADSAIYDSDLVLYILGVDGSVTVLTERGQLKRTPERIAIEARRAFFAWVEAAL